MTPFPVMPRDVVSLTVREFTFLLDPEYAPSFAEICGRFGDDANRAVVWLHRFRALQALNRDQGMMLWIRSQSDSPRELLFGGVFEVAATQPLNDRWEFDASAFFAAVDALIASRDGTS